MYILTYIYYFNKSIEWSAATAAWPHQIHGGSVLLCTIEVVKLQQKTLILAGSQEGINETLQDDPVPLGW
jgi:hypothetical protein